MASHVLTRPDVFQSGSVSAYARTAHGVPSSGPPEGSAVSTASVSGNSVTFTGLADGTAYIAYQGTPDRYVTFTTAPAAAAGTTAAARLGILGWATRPDDTGDCYPEPFDILATNDVWKQMILRFGASNAAAPTQRAGVYGNFAVPKSYTQDATLVIVWTATLTHGRRQRHDVIGSSGQRGRGDGHRPGAALRRLEATIDLTDANFTADDTVEFFFARDGVDAADTMAGSAILFNLFFQYTG
jgi:hypothetical protein